ncbi:6-carboxytetrahydropterin synthase QueD [Dehalobacterium formicoaceticum]|uniref:6-carboxy-5,6,7,8-tetrahydropterin synthase n=1 Tax=Dehalobacterium formicoaceticum TaxID=51515 RepID=A0ABT1Y619_9FIRM|nr:6-carboxytetrahydropterin synthase QueD [Dehalobacterium formicoaceticum]MCR6546328.1 6-carboxytetrahydropterin synthase QueD [Dehalobacterium formicoaceticum]
MFEISVQDHFDAAHFLKEYQGKCAKIHGHTWQVEIKIQGEDLDKTGMVVDFSVVKNELKKVLDPLDHVLINELTAFHETNPTAENISCYIFQEMSKALSNYPVWVSRVTVWESPGAAAAYFEKE